MENRNFLKTVREWILKYKYAAMVLLVGIGLMLIPNASHGSDKEPQQGSHLDAQPSVEAQLAAILANVKGAGQVQVMLTVRVGEQTVYQTDSSQTSSDNSQSSAADTVIVSGADRGQTGLVCQKSGPVYQGAIILCQGAGQPSVRLAIVDAVSKITGLSADKISVLEMK